MSSIVTKKCLLIGTWEENNGGGRKGEGLHVMEQRIQSPSARKEKKKTSTCSDSTEVISVL